MVGELRAVEKTLPRERFLDWLMSAERSGILRGRRVEAVGGVGHVAGVQLVSPNLTRASNSPPICTARSPSRGADNIFIDTDNVPLGVDFRDHIRAEISKTDAVAALIGPGWAEDRLHTPTDFVRTELLAAEELGKLIVPVLVGGRTPPPSQRHPSTGPTSAAWSATSPRPLPPSTPAHRFRPGNLSRAAPPRRPYRLGVGVRVLAGRVPARHRRRRPHRADLGLAGLKRVTSVGHARRRSEGGRRWVDSTARCAS